MLNCGRILPPTVKLSRLNGSPACGSIDFEHRGLRYHIWEYADDAEPVGVETNLRYAGRDEEIEGDYDRLLAEHLKKEF